MTRRPTVLIYRSELLSLSETFITAQARTLQRFEPVLVGARRLPHGQELPANTQLLTTSNKLPDRLKRWCFLHSGFAPRWARTLARSQPALLHAHFATDAAEALPLAHKLRVPLLVTLHGYDVMSDDRAHAKTPRGRIFLRRRQALWRRAELFLCVSEAVRERALARGFPEHKLRSGVIGVDCDRLRERETLHAEPTILFVGRLVEKKGCSLLLQAVELVQKQLPQASLVVIGDGPERPALEREAKERVPGTRFLGAQPASAVMQAMRAARVLAVPSITASDGDAEGLPTVLGEALALGVPVAAFQSSGIPELVRHESEALLAPERDIPSLAANLLRLCTDDTLAHRLGHAGRQRAETHFHLRTQTAQLEQVYAETVDAWQARAHPSRVPRAQATWAAQPGGEQQ